MKTVVAILALLSFASLARADNTYTYTGTPFTDGQPNQNPGTSLTGFFTLAGPLPDGASMLAISPESFSFTDGNFIWNPGDVNGQDLFQVSTDASGNIVAWNVSLSSIGFNAPGSPEFEYDLTSSWWQYGSEEDRSELNQDFGPGDEYFEISRTAGTWTDPVTTPEPSSRGLALLGFAMLIGVHVLRARS